MNKERIESLIGFFENELLDNKFTMRRYGTDGHLTIEKSIDALEHGCGTAGCIAGWAIVHFKNEAIKLNNRGMKHSNVVGRQSSFHIARTLLGLKFDEASDLFYVSNAETLAHFTKEMAIARLKGLIHE